MSHNIIAWFSIAVERQPSLQIGKFTISQIRLNLKTIKESRKGYQKMPSGYKTLKTYKTYIKIIIPRTNQSFHTMNKIARKGGIIPVSSKPL